MAAAQRFFRQAVKVVRRIPENVTTGRHDSYRRAIRETLGEDVVHRFSRSMNNRIEQDHRGIKGCYHPMRDFGAFDSAARFCSAHDEVRDYVRHRTRMGEVVPLGIQREQFRARSAELRAMHTAA